MEGRHFTFKFSFLIFLMLFTLSKGRPYNELDYGRQLSSFEDRLRHLPQALMLYDEDSDSLSSAPIGYTVIDRPRLSKIKRDPNLKDDNNELRNTDDTDQENTGNEVNDPADYNPVNSNDAGDKQDDDTENSRDKTNNFNNDYNEEYNENYDAQDSEHDNDNTDNDNTDNYNTDNDNTDNDITNNDNTDNDNGLSDDATNKDKGASSDSNVDSVNSDDGGLKKVSCSTSKAITLNNELLKEIAVSSSDEATEDNHNASEYNDISKYDNISEYNDISKYDNITEYNDISENNDVSEYNNISDDLSDSAVTTKHNTKIITDDDESIIETSTEPYTVVYKSPGLPQKLRGPDHFIDDI